MRKFLAALSLVIVFAASCAGDSFDREGLIETMMSDGLDEQQAACTVDGMVEEFGEEAVATDTFTSGEGPGADAQERQLQILTRCLFGS